MSEAAEGGDSKRLVPAVALSPVYPIVDFGADIEIFSGQFDVEGHCFEGRMWSPPVDRLSVRWELESASIGLENESVVIDHPLFGSVQLEALVTSGDGRGIVQRASLGDGSALCRVLAHWVNVPVMHPLGLIGRDDQVWRGRMVVEANGWTLTMDSRPDLFGVLRDAKDRDEPFVTTYVGQIARQDDGSFDEAAANRVLSGWQLALSLAFARWVAPSLNVGYDRDGQRVWEQWPAWRCDRLGVSEGWWTWHEANDLRDFLEAFLGAFLDERDHPLVRHFAMHILESHGRNMSPEASIMVSFAGVEYFGWNILHNRGDVSRADYKELGADGVLRRLLGSASIPTNIPDDLGALNEVVLPYGHTADGPGVLAWLRNRLVHPKDAEEPYRLEGLVWQTSLLAREYAELILLHHIGYAGNYAKRYPPGRWSGTNAPVPWAAS